MEVEYTSTDNYKGEPRQVTESIASFLYDEILYTEKYNGREKVHLEEQPTKVLQAMGRLIEKLLDKGIFDLEDLKYISECNWGRKADSLKLKKEAENA